MNTKAARRLVALGVVMGWIKFPAFQGEQEQALKEEFHGGLKDYKGPLLMGEHERWDKGTRAAIYEMMGRKAR